MIMGRRNSVRAKVRFPSPAYMSDSDGTIRKTSAAEIMTQTMSAPCSGERRISYAAWAGGAEADD